MITKTLCLRAVLGVLLATPGILEAGVNTWTGGRPVETLPGAASRVAAHPDQPDVVYGAFGTGLYRSADGGRNWGRVAPFDNISALLVHPASASTIYVGTGGWNGAVYRSLDGGETWEVVLWAFFVESLAGSPTDPNVVFVGTWAEVHKSSDAGRTWTSGNLAGLVCSLVIDPRDPATLYAGGEGWAGGLAAYPGSLGRTVDAGSTWTNVRWEPPFDSVSAIEVDPVSVETLYVGTGHYRDLTGDFSDYNDNRNPDLFKSEDAGATWTSVRHGLPEANVRSLLADRQSPGTIYAATDSGLYRTRDAGESWTPYGQALAELPISSILIAGRRLYAGTTYGVYELERARGPIDLAGSARGESRVLVWDGAHRSIGSVNAVGGWTSGVPGEASQHWTAVALAEHEGRAHVLWQCLDGRSALEIVGPSGRVTAKVFDKRAGWIATDVSGRSDGATNILWTGVEGQMRIASVSASGDVAEGPLYGPAAGWSAVAMAEGLGSEAWVLWRGTDGRFAVSLHRDGEMVFSFKYRADLPWAVEDLAVGADGRPRLLRTSPGGLASLATVDAEGRLVGTHDYELPGLTPRRVAAGGDGLTRILFSDGDGNGELLLLNPDNTLSARHALR